jgi:NitT/TauT family transport system permease protein
VEARTDDLAGVGRPTFQLRSWHWNIASLITAVAGWALVVQLFQPAAYILPGPLSVVERVIESRQLLLESATPTIGVILAGFLLGLLVAVPFGMLIVALPALDKLVYPLVVAFNSIPKVALAPLFVVWFGYGATPRIVITFSIAFFPILVNTITGLRSVDPEMVRLARSMGGSTTRVFLKLRLPHSLPSIFAGTKVATSLAVIGAIIGEFVASDNGWGYLLIQAQGQLDTTLIFAILILLAVFATVLYYAVELVERVAVPWHASQRKHG